MSDEEAPPLTKAAEPAAKTSKAVLGLLVLNLGATGFVAFKLLTAQPAEAAAAHAPPAAAPSAEVTCPVIALDPFVVNLDEPGTSRYLKVTLQMELVHGAEETARIRAARSARRSARLSPDSGWAAGACAATTVGSLMPAPPVRPSSSREAPGRAV